MKKTDTIENFEIKIDPRLELLSIVLNFADWPYIGKFTQSHPYYQNMLAHFTPYQDHPAVQWIKQAGENWNLDDPATSILWVSDPPNMQIIHPYPLHPTSQISIPDFEKTIQLLNQFATDTNFIEFWQKNKSLYATYENEIKSLLPYQNHIQLMIDFYGEEKAYFKVFPAPLFNGASFGPQLNLKNKQISHFIATFNSSQNGAPAFSDSLLRMLIFHEFGHSFVNPICEEYRTEIFKHENLFQYLKDEMSLITYTDWFPTTHEHLVRTGQHLLLRIAGYEKEAQNDYQDNLRKGFSLLPFFTQKMEYYLENRATYPSFRNFFPELLKVYEQVKPMPIKKPMRHGLLIRKDNQNFFIRHIWDRSAAAQSDLKPGDQIVAINNQPLGSNDDLTQFEDLWYQAKQDQKITFQIKRGELAQKHSLHVPFIDAYTFIKK